MKKNEFGKEPEDQKAQAGGQDSSLKNRRTLSPQPAAPTQAFLAEHTVKEGETLSHIAQAYYGSSVREKWMPIYEANKAVIGDNPAALRLGIVLKIPKLS